MTWMNDLMKSFGSNKTGWVKQAWNWKLPGKKSEYYPSGKASLKEIYSPAGFKAGGHFLGKKVGGSAGGFTRGFGKGMWVGAFPKGMPKVLDVGSQDEGGGGLVNVTIPDFPTVVIPDFPTIPKFPKIEIPEGGLIQIPKDILGGVEMPFSGVKIPSMTLMDDEGSPNPVVIGGLALVAYMVLKGGK